MNQVRITEVRQESDVGSDGQGVRGSLYRLRYVVEVDVRGREVTVQSQHVNDLVFALDEKMAYTLTDEEEVEFRQQFEAMK